MATQMKILHDRLTIKGSLNTMDIHKLNILSPPAVVRNLIKSGVNISIENATITDQFGVKHPNVSVYTLIE